MSKNNNPDSSSPNDPNKSSQSFTLVKDLSILMENRSEASLYVIESNPDFCDQDSVQSMSPEPYDGSDEYKNLN